MACILVVAECEDGARLRLVLDESVATGELDADPVCSQLIERLGWAIVEAEELERGTVPARLSRPSTPQGHRVSRPARRRSGSTRADRVRTRRSEERRPHR